MTPLAPRTGATSIALALGLACVGLGCGREEPKVAKPAAPAAAAAPADGVTDAVRVEAKQTYDARCAECHGGRGAGNGMKSDTLVPRPRNFQDPGWQKSVTNDYLEQIIVQGGEAVGKSSVMPAQPDLADRAELVRGLRKHIRSFAE